MKYFFLIILLLSSYCLYAQSSFISRNSEDYKILERLELMYGRNSNNFFPSSGTISRKDVVFYLQELLEFKSENEEDTRLTEFDEKIILNLLKKYDDWYEEERETDTDYTLFDVFYKKRAEFFSVKNQDYYVAINPIIAYQQMLEFGNTKQNLFQNRKGLEIRAIIKNRIGLYSTFTDNQERGPLYYQRYVGTQKAVPMGVSYYKSFKPEKSGAAQDYLLANAYVDAEVIKNTMNVSFGYDRFHIGDGYRSIFLSDMGTNYLFFRINTRFWRLNYENLFMELTPQYKRGADQLLPKKYAAMHSLNLNINRWLNVGVFESVVFGRKDHFEFQYLNPVILYRTVEQSLGSPDNALLGANFKINTGQKLLLYGQVYLDEFKFSEVIGRKGWWANKYAMQIGMKWADIFGIKNFMLQSEFNMIRPFMYSYNDSIADYSNYNQSLAHIAGANLAEFDLNLYYQPTKKITLTMNNFFYKQGRDSSAAISNGGNILKLNSLISKGGTRDTSYGYYLFSGFPSTVAYSNLNACYEIMPNMYIDLGVGLRIEKASISKNPSDNTPFIYSGFRWNATRRKYDF